MKKILMTLAFVLTGLGSAWADDDVTVDPITIPQGSTATLSISLANTNEYRQLFQFVLTLPEGVTVVPNSAKLSNRFNDKADLSFTEPTTRNYQFLCQAGTDVTSISGTSGVIMTVQLLAASTLSEGTNLTGQLKDIEVTNQSSQAFKPADKTFNITIGAPLETVELYETSETPPTASNGAVDVTVNRTIKANEWSTICLPFDMTEAQVKTAFGDDVQLADFSSWSFEGTVDNVDKITLGFTDVTSIDEHHPYIIKVKNNITSFKAYNVTITTPPNTIPYDIQVYTVPAASIFDDPINYSAFFIGNYTTGIVSEKYLFLSGNEFWYSKGFTNIKAFRATFYMRAPGNKIIALNTYSTNPSRITMTFNEDETTGIRDNKRVTNSGKTYNLSGQQVEKPVKGLYIQDGKKVIFK